MKIKLLPLRFLPFISLLILWTISSCSGEGPGAPENEILEQAPFRALTDSIRQEPDNDRYYFQRAVLLNKSNLPELALADFQKAWVIRSDERYAFGVANAWLDRQPDSAVAFLSNALRRLPESYLLRITLARAQDALQQTQAAMSTVDTVVSHYPGVAEAWLIRSDLLSKLEKPAAALTSLEKAYQLAPRNLEIAFKLIYAYAESKDARALSISDTLILKDTQQLYADPYYVKGLYFANTGDGNRAIRWFDETIRHDINYLNAYIEKGKILLNQKKNRQAQQVFELANRIKPAFPDAYYWMGVCQEAQGMNEEARLNYEKAYGLDKSFTEAREGADRLSK